MSILFPRFGLRGPSVFAALVAIAIAAPASAQSGPPEAVPAGVYTKEADGQVIIRATRIRQPLDVDGRLNDAAYREVPSFSGFIQVEPNEGEPITERTEAWILFDDDNFYVTVRCWDSRASGIVATEMRRDSTRNNQNDNISVSMDTFYDGRNGFSFGLSAAGGMRDAVLNDEIFQADWNGVYLSRAGVDDEGWTAEYAIPFKTLRYPPGREQMWHIQIRRIIRSDGRNETAYITPLKAEWGQFAGAKFSLAATLVGVEVPDSGLNLEIKPYLIAPINTDLTATPRLRNDFAPDGGVDVKYGITKSFTADFSYNTDFAQVEIDEAQINLTRFNLNFPEKREFFLEGQGLYDFGGQAARNAVRSPNAPVLFYSRRIGLSGGRAVPVIGGGRLTGMAGDWMIGAFSVETDDEPLAGAVKTNFSVLRLRRNILRRSNLGAIYTRRSVSTIGPGGNDVAGVDLNLALLDNVYFTNYVARSWTSSLPGNDVMYRSMFHYFGDKFGLALDRQVVQPNFNPEIGFMRRMDFRRSFAEVRVSPRPRNHPFVRRVSLTTAIDYITNNQNVLESREAQGNVQVDFHSSDNLSVEHLRQFELLPTPFRIATDVVIPAGGYDFQSTRFAYSAGGQRRISGTTAVEVGSFYSGDRTTWEYRGRVDLSSRFGVEPTLSFNWIDLPQGRFTSTIVGSRAVYTMSPRLFVTALVQHSSSNDALSTNVRLRWEYEPGSELFVVLFEGRSTEPPQGVEALQNRGFVVKINRLFRW